jgi:hypothetical protein
MFDASPFLTHSFIFWGPFFLVLLVSITIFASFPFLHILSFFLFLHLLMSMSSLYLYLWLGR